jgi:hypothetical protein
MCPLNPGSMNPAVGDAFEGRAQHEFTRMQHKGVCAVHLDQRREVVLLDLRVDVGVAGVVENPEEAVQPHVDAGRLNQRCIERVEAK